MTAAAQKLLKREALLSWWLAHLDQTEAARKQTSKPYRIPTGKFFAELHTVSDESIRRALTGYDVRFENKKWRSLQLADHLVDWLPELALKASDLVAVQHLQMRQKMRDSLSEIRRHSTISNERLLAETLLHAILREATSSGPSRGGRHRQSKPRTASPSNGPAEGTQIQPCNPCSARNACVCVPPAPEARWITFAGPGANCRDAASAVAIQFAGAACPSRDQK